MSDEKLREVVSFKFEGGFADQHQLGLYEASRFQYGAARLLYSLEYLRRKGQYPERVNPAHLKVDFRINAGEAKCFLQTVYELGTPVLAEFFIKAPLDAVLAWALNWFDRKDEKLKEFKELALGLAKEETKRAEIHAADRDKLYEIIKMQIEQNNKDKEALHELLKAKSGIEAGKKREAVIAEHKSELDKLLDLPTEERNLIIGKSRAQLTEMLYPLKRGADTLSISVGSAAEVSVFDEKDLIHMEGDRRDKLPTDLVGTIKSYDKETGLGKWRGLTFPKPIGFLVRAAQRDRLKDEILETMKEEDVVMRFFIVRDAGGVPKYLIFEDFLDIAPKQEDDN